MKRKIYFTLNDFVKKLTPEEMINIYDKDGMSVNMQVCEIPTEYLEMEVIKYKADKAVPNLHFKLEKLKEY